MDESIFTLCLVTMFNGDFLFWLIDRGVRVVDTLNSSIVYQIICWSGNSVITELEDNEGKLISKDWRFERRVRSSLSSKKSKVLLSISLCMIYFRSKFEDLVSNLYKISKIEYNIARNLDLEFRILKIRNPLSVAVENLQNFSKVSRIEAYSKRFESFSFQRLKRFKAYN